VRRFAIRGSPPEVRTASKTTNDLKQAVGGLQEEADLKESVHPRFPTGKPLSWHNLRTNERDLEVSLSKMHARERVAAVRQFPSAHAYGPARRSRSTK